MLVNWFLVINWLSIGYQLVVNWLSIDYWSTITNVGVIDQSTRIKSITNLSHHTLHGYKATLPAGSDATVTRAGPKKRSTILYQSIGLLTWKISRKTLFLPSNMGSSAIWQFK